MSVVLVVSTYELGGRPIGITSVTPMLRAAGHEVLTCDLSVESWPSEALQRADCLCCSVPMHTALRLTMDVARRARSERPGLPLFFYGLYAGVARAAGLLEAGDEAIERDEAAQLLACCARLGASTSASPASETERLPSHDALPSLEAYARFRIGDEQRLVATVASTTGCNHRCRHCPVPVVHHGRSSAIPEREVLAEIATLVAAGARHVHFADPDFFNRPRHARRIVEGLHRMDPELTIDATIKVSHLLRFPDLVGELASQGLVTVVSAFEATSDEVLARLDKGHRAADLHRCVALLRANGIEPRPSLMPFTPWTTRRDLVELLDFVASHDLVPNVDPVQYSIRLLLPPSSLLLTDTDPVLAASLDEPAPGALSRGWRAQDPLLDELATALGGLVETAASAGEEPAATYWSIRAAVFSALGQVDPGPPPFTVAPGPPAAQRGRIDEPWFCCAEPTLEQFTRLAPAPEAVPLGTAIRRGALRS